MARGRIAGLPTKPHRGSTQWQLSHMLVGDAIWVECTPENYAQVMSNWNPVKERRTEGIKHFVIETTVWTAVRNVGEQKTLVRVERKA